MNTDLMKLNSRLQDLEPYAKEIEFIKKTIRDIKNSCGHKYGTILKQGKLFIDYDYDKEFILILCNNCNEKIIIYDKELFSNYELNNNTQCDIKIFNIEEVLL